MLVQRSTLNTTRFTTLFTTLVQRSTLNTTLFTTLFTTLVQRSTLNTTLFTTLFTTLVRSATAWACLTTTRQPAGWQAGGPAHELPRPAHELPRPAHGQREELLNPVRCREEELTTSRGRDVDELATCSIRGWALAAEPTVTELDAIYYMYAWSLDVLRSEERGAWNYLLRC